ncbi:hypothetical protein Taro_003579 [Colocasia esculenta]|uniref:Uncharacterized protein n=1 Tax=Colocasia esculenta TaxID=4460 RepID=A0A843TJS4_COLES|nr:hypothetical protein [Colocasia esculenta]
METLPLVKVRCVHRHLILDPGPDPHVSSERGRTQSGWTTVPRLTSPNGSGATRSEAVRRRTDWPAPGRTPNCPRRPIRRALVCESSHSRCGLSRRAQFRVVVLRLLFEPSRSVCESLNSRVFGVVVLQCVLYSRPPTRALQATQCHCPSHHFSLSSRVRLVAANLSPLVARNTPSTGSQGWGSQATVTTSHTGQALKCPLSLALLC